MAGQVDHVTFPHSLDVQVFPDKQSYENRDNRCQGIVRLFLGYTVDRNDRVALVTNRLKEDAANVFGVDASRLRIAWEDGPVYLASSGFEEWMYTDSDILDSTTDWDDIVGQDYRSPVFKVWLEEVAKPSQAMEELYRFENPHH